jgi:alkyl hydroperoxide reductase subunit AhpC
MPRSEGGLFPMNIPMFEDLSQSISYSYGVRISDEKDEMCGVSLRGTFIIDDAGVLRHSSVNDLPVGRNVDEVLRTLKAFQHVAKHGEVCPANWDQSKKAMNVGNSDKLNEFWKI